MVTENIDIKVNVYEAALKGLMKNLGATAKTLKGITAPAARVSESFVNMQKRVRAYTDTLKQANQVALSGLFKEPIRASQKFQDTIQKNTNALLSLLFLGIWLQMVMTNALKSIFEGYKKAIPEGHKFNRMTNKLSANWEYFKFQLADALANSPLFQKFVAFLINILKKLQALSPEAKTFLTITLAIVAVFGGMLFILAQVGLGMQGLVMIATFLQKTVNNFRWGNFLAIAAIVGAVVAVIAAIMLLGSIISKTREESELFDEKWTNIIDMFKRVINGVLSPFNIEIKNMGELMFWVSGIAQILFSGFTSGLNVLISLAKFVGSTFINIWRTQVSVFKDVAAAAVAVWDAIRGKGLDTGAFQLTNLRKQMESFKSDMDGIWNEWQENNKDIANNMITFSEIEAEIDKYRKKLEQTTKSTRDLATESKLISGDGYINNALNKSLSETKIPETSSNKQVNNTFYIDGQPYSMEGTEEDISNVIMSIQKKVQTDLGYDF